ncbi:protein of unknown function [Streptococcus thermophilus]|nr:protein of unknown function [Streptococcus thermophilus]
MVFYSDEFTNFPLSLDLTGKSENFKITITDSYLEEENLEQQKTKSII